MPKPSAVSNKKRKISMSLHRRLSFWIIILIIVVMIGIMRQSNVQNNQNTLTKPQPVVLAPVTTSDVPVYISALGSVTPVYSVTVKTQLNGTLIQVLFTEGQMVKTGQLLAEIDPRPYQAQLIEYEGQLVRDQALLANALIDLKRYQQLWKQDSISQQTLATQESLVQQYKGAIQIDLGLIQITKVNLIYCKITSPVDGRIGLRLVDPGNFVQTSDTTGIAVINTLNPINVTFTIPEDNIRDILNPIYAGKKLLVEAYDRTQSKLLATGTLLTIDNQIDTSTGTVKLKAVFNNQHNTLFPSQFVNIQLLARTLKNALVVPTAAIQYSPQNSFVYLFSDKDQTVTAKPVTVGVTQDGRTTIAMGLTKGQQVVVEGADKLTDGAKVTVTNPQPITAKPATNFFSRWRQWL